MSEREALVAKLRELGFIAGHTTQNDLDAADKLLEWFKRPSDPGIPVYRHPDGTDEVLKG